jgi:hypothetical protein
MSEPAGWKSETLAQSDFGSVLRCPGGCVHVSFQNVGFRLSERQYWELVELLSKASLALRSRSGGAN